jgi:hypothetical protein
MKQTEAIIEAFLALGGTRSISEIKSWVDEKYGLNKWKDFGTTMADMVPQIFGGNKTSTIPEDLRILEKVDRGLYRLISGEMDE